ncbi:MAG: phosphodiester glycosidase family protein [Blastocatellia bacterium]
MNKKTGGSPTVKKGATKGTKWLSFTVGLLLLMSVAAAQTAPNEQRFTETLAPGIEHSEIKRGDFNSETGDRWQIHLLTIAPGRATIKLGRAMDEIVGSETTSSLAARHGALAAINAGFFRVGGTYRGEPDGVFVMSGKVMSEEINRGQAWALTNAGGRVQIAFARVEIKAEVQLNGKETIRLNGFNRPREKDELIAYTPEFHRTTLTTPEGREVIVRRGRVVEIVDGKGSQAIPTDGFVLSATGAAKAVLPKLRRGMRVTIRQQMLATPVLPFTPEFIVGGGPALLVNKHVQTDTEGFNPKSFYHFRHPRTAIGMRADGTLVLVTVDGRQPKKSVGVTIPELIQLMQEFGCVQAINLDGGGSTTMVIRGKVVNSVSDATGERAVSDALLVLPRNP